MTSVTEAVTTTAITTVLLWDLSLLDCWLEAPGEVCSSIAGGELEFTSGWKNGNTGGGLDGIIVGGRGTEGAGLGDKLVGDGAGASPGI